MTEDAKGGSSKPSQPFFIESRLDPLLSEGLKSFVDSLSSRTPDEDTGDGESFLKASQFPPPAELFGRERDEGDDFPGIPLREIIKGDEYQDTDKILPLPMGVTINGDPLIVGLEELPHLLVASITGPEKNTFVNSCIIGLCSMRRPDELKMLLLDSKQGEIERYEKLPHILTPPVTDPKKAVRALAWAIREMERRYCCFAASEVRNLASYNEIMRPKDRLPHIVIVADELADLKETGGHICNLAQNGHTAGIHLLLATQCPSENFIPDLARANIPARVDFKLHNATDLHTLISTDGAEKPPGKGDTLFLSTQDLKPVQVQAAWIDEAAIARWLDYLVGLFDEPTYTDLDNQGDAPAGFESEGGFDDALLEEAIHAVISSGMASASGLQRRLRVGFTRAERLLHMMEYTGIVGPSDDSRPREILVDEDEAEEILDRLRSKEWVDFSLGWAPISNLREISYPPSTAPAIDNAADTGNQEGYRLIMKKLVAQYGPDLYLDAKRLSGLIGDYFAADKRMKKILLRAVADGVAEEIHALQGVGGDTLDFEIPRIMRKFIDENALIESTGRGAVICFAGGLLELPKDITNAG